MIVKNIEAKALKKALEDINISSAIIDDVTIDINVTDTSQIIDLINNYKYQDVKVSTEEELLQQSEAMIEMDFRLTSLELGL